MIETDMEPEVKTFRGRSLEEILPQIRAELGPDAIVLRRREGLTGGIGGFFQRPYVEVEASGPDGGAAMQAAAEAALEARNDRATADGMASPAIQLLLEQASPFADQLHAAQHADRSAAERAADILGSTAMTDPGLYGPQPTPPAEPPAYDPPAPEPPAYVPPAPEPPAYVPPAPEAEVVEPDVPARSEPAAERPRPEPPTPPATPPSMPEVDPAGTPQPGVQPAEAQAQAVAAQEVAAPEATEADVVTTPAEDVPVVAEPGVTTPSAATTPAEDVPVVPEPGARALEADTSDDLADDPLAAPEAFEAPAAETFEVPETPIPPMTTAVLAPRPAAAIAAERRLVLAGLDSALAADVVGEAMTHGLPFASPRSLKKLVRSALARRIPVLAGRGPRPRALALVGAAGAGKTTAAGHLAAAYAASGTLPVLAVALRAPDHGAALRARLSPADVAVHAAADGHEARRILELARGAMVIVDTPPIGLRDAAAIKALAADLEALDLHEVHLALPATLSAAAAAELARALEGIGLTHVALTRTDETEHPGAPIGFCITSGGPLSYLCAHDAVEPADPSTLAQRLLP